MMEITEETLKGLEDLLKDATELPWWIDSHGHRMCAEGGTKTVFVTDDKTGPATRNPVTGNLSHWPNDVDASLVVEAVNALPGLLAELKRREERITQLQGLLDSSSLAQKLLTQRCERLEQDGPGWPQGKYDYQTMFNAIASATKVVGTSIAISVADFEKAMGGRGPAYDTVPNNCRQRLKKELRPYPKSSCAVCGQFSPNWEKCDSKLLGGEV